MANPEHLEILKQGVKLWNEWRDSNPDVYPDLSNEDFSGFHFSKINFSHTDLSSSVFFDVNLSESNLSDAYCFRTNLYRADLSYANLSGSDLEHANVSLADLYCANLRSAALHNTNLCFSDLYGVQIESASFAHTLLGGTCLTDAIGLDLCVHVTPSILDHETIAISGNLPLTFLRGCGLPDKLIEYISSLLKDPIQFYACFISFTETDDAFSERLYNDLQAKGVRCWRWKEDAKWGKTLMRSIDEAVRLYDKLIIICSEQSLKAPAVIREIERALQKEDDLAREGKEGEVLFPIRLDDYIFAGWNHHRKADVIAKNVGDFRKWKDHDSYQRSFDRLLRDLKA